MNLNLPWSHLWILICKFHKELHTFVYNCKHVNGKYTVCAIFIDNSDAPWNDLYNWIYLNLSTSNITLINKCNYLIIQLSLSRLIADTIIYILKWFNVFMQWYKENNIYKKNHSWTSDLEMHAWKRRFHLQRNHVQYQFCFLYKAMWSFLVFFL